MSSFPRGVCPILTTPFHDDGEIDYDSLRQLVRGLIDMRVSAITMFGIASEYYKLTAYEMAQMVEVVVEEAASKIPIIVSVTAHATEVAVKEARAWQEAGADLLMLLPPFFLKPGADAFSYHVTQVCSAVNLPVIVQYAPEQTGVAIDAEVFMGLWRKHPDVGFKIENKPPGRLLSTLVQRSEGRIPVYVGNAGFQLLEGLKRGAIGVMPGASMADLYVRIVEDFEAGDLEAATAIHNRLLSVLNVIRQSVEQIIKSEKLISVRRGLIASAYCRKPSFEFDEIFEWEFDRYVDALSDLLDRPRSRVS